MKNEPREPTNEERKLTDILVQMVFAATEDEVFCAKSLEEKAAWISKTLRKCGYENKPVGSSFCYLTEVRD